jgi:3-phosphoshikimate 1-carboxyvinyltransferase
VSLPEKLEIIPLEKPPAATVQVPGSKSITNRALVLAALTSKKATWRLRGALQSEDTEVMIECLRKLGFRVLTEWSKSVVVVASSTDRPQIPNSQADLFVANSGTTMRFLCAVVSLGHGCYSLDGTSRMRERPIADLLDALQQLGVEAFSVRHDGCPPVIVNAKGLRGGTVRIRGDISSQFLSGLLLAAPFASGPSQVKVEGPLVSSPYVAMTIQMLHQWGLECAYHIDGDCSEFDGRRANLPADGFGHAAQHVCFHVPGCQNAESSFRVPPTRAYDIEPDASAASYFFAAVAIAGGRVTVPELPMCGLQGDIRFIDVLGDMGCHIKRCSGGVSICSGKLHGITVDMNDISDTVMTLAAVACFADGPTTIRNVAHIRHKETDRLAALATELRRVGAEVDEYPDGLKITPRPLHGTEIETYNDHRMAMSMALIGLKVPGIVIKNPGCVAKTYPGFFEDLEKLR